MKAVILAGGLGTRLSEETTTRPKPMIDVCGRPLIWHVMKSMARFDVDDFVVCCGYRGYQIKEYFANYFLHRSDITIDLKTSDIQVHASVSEPWRVTLVDTGAETMTGGRLARVRAYLDDEPFLFTYGDGVADVDIHELVATHQRGGRLATVTAVQAPGRFGALDLDGERVTSFREKLDGIGSWINGGFFVLSPRTLAYIDGDDCVWEQEPVRRLAAEGQLGVYHHQGIFCPVDTLRDKARLEELCNTGRLPWSP